MSQETPPLAVQTIQIPSIEDDRGILNLIEISEILPFSIERVFFIHHVKQDRGGHAHIYSDQFLIMVQGVCEVIVYDGTKSSTFLLNQDNEGLLIPKLNFLELTNFSSDAILLVLANTKYQKEDVIQSKAAYKSYLLK